MSENIVIAIVLFSLGAAVAALGALARLGRIALALAGHTRDNTSADSWKRAHERIGGWLILAGLGAVAAGIVAAAVPDAAGWAAVVGCVWVAVVPVVGAAVGVRELRSAGPLP